MNQKNGTCKFLHLENRIICKQDTDNRSIFSVIHLDLKSNYVITSPTKDDLNHQNSLDVCSGVKKECDLVSQNAKNSLI